MTECLKKFFSLSLNNIMFRASFDASSKNMSKISEYFEAFGAYIGEYTLEIDIFKKSIGSDRDTLCSIFNQLTNGGQTQKKNFSAELSSGRYNKCLAKIESTYSGIGKGRFAQRLATYVSASMIPEYVSNAIDAIVKEVRCL